MTYVQPERWNGRILVALAAAAFILLPLKPARSAECVGDCDSNGAVAINELVTIVNIALGSVDMAACDADTNDDGAVSINELVMAVTLAALEGCDSGAADPHAELR